MSSSFPERPVYIAERRLQMPAVAFALVLPALSAAPALGQTEPKLAVDMSVFASPDPFLLSNDNGGAVMFEVSAAPSVTITNSRGSTLVARGTIRRRDYSRLYGHYMLGDARVEGRYRDSEYLNIGMLGGFERGLVIDVLTSSPDGAIDPGAIRNAWFGALDAEWRPNAFELITPEVRFDRSLYSGSDLLVDGSTLSMSVAYSRRTGQRTSWGLRVRDTVNRATGMATVNNAAIYATYNRRLGERMRLLVELGAARTSGQIDITDGGATRRPGRILLAGRADLCREGGEWPGGITGCLSTTLDSEVSGLGGMRRNAVASATMSLPVAQKFVLRGTADYRRTSQIGGSRATGPPVSPSVGTTDGVRGVVALDWRLRTNLTLTGTAQYLRRQVVTGERIGAAFFGIQLSYKPGARR